MKNENIICYKIDMKQKDSNLLFGKRLAQLRKSSGLTQTVFGKKIGVSQRVIAYYECETNNPPASLLPKIAKALDVSIDDLFSVKDENEKSNNKVWKKLRKVEKLQPDEQKMIINLIDKLAQK
ncbi:MAG: XRE family transcriptional regulator [uncultured bacterium]|nr:MAG: XRE family transcriptional regulator [uncultured bacterium]